MTGPSWRYTIDTGTDPAHLPPPGPGQLPTPGPDPVAAARRQRAEAALWWLLAALVVAALWWVLNRTSRPASPGTEQVALGGLGWLQ